VRFDKPQLRINPVAATVLATVDHTRNGQTALSVVPPFDKSALLFARKRGCAPDLAAQVIQAQTVLRRRLVAVRMIEQLASNRLRTAQIAFRLTRLVLAADVNDRSRWIARTHPPDIITASALGTNRTAHNSAIPFGGTDRRIKNASSTTFGCSLCCYNQKRNNKQCL